jgi:Na+-transporting methylmalonyl-CoA/oxaloacetate decarboxylase gamma subunit
VGPAIAVVIAVLVILVIVAAGIAVLASRKRRAPAAPAAEPARSAISPPAPMIGLESALDQVTDRAGTKLRQKLEAEAAVVDDLRVADDTGPLLRRALDRVEHAPEPPAPQAN